MPSLEAVQAAIVAIGSFNPPLITVEWLRSNSLVGEAEAAAAQSDADFLVSRQLTRFKTELAAVQIIENQLSINSTGPVSPALCDLGVGIFELLPHTPVSAIGLNFIAHYKFEKVADYLRFGDRLAPKAIWNELVPDRSVGIIDLTLLLQEGKRETPGVRPNHQRIQIQPSSVVTQGVALLANNHFGEDSNDTPLKTGEGAASVARRHWADCYKQSMAMFEKLIELTMRTTPQANSREAV